MLTNKQSGIPAEKRIQVVLSRLHLFPTSRAYTIAATGFVIAAYLLLPENPVWDWSKVRIPNVIFIYLNILLLSAAVFVDRRSILNWLTEINNGRRLMALAVIPLVFLCVFTLLYFLLPSYLQSILREYGLVEPFTLFFYFTAAIAGTEHVKALRQNGQDFRPYKLLVVFYIVMLFEECDWLGIFGGIFGRIDGVYLGSIHDLLNLWYKSSHRTSGGALIVFGIAAIIFMLWKTGYLNRSFLKFEVVAFSSFFIYLWFILCLLAAVYDIDNTALIIFHISDFPEEALELFGALSLCIASIMKYCRDIQTKTLVSAT